MSLFNKEIDKILKGGFDIFKLNADAYCEKVMSRKRATDRQRIDALLELDANMYMYLGYDSTKAQRDETKKKSRILYRTIKKINHALGDSLLSHQDKP